MNEIQVFSNDYFKDIRTMNINGEPYFVGKDIAESLGYAKPLNAIASHVDEDDSLKQGLTDKLGRMQETIFINESGMYSLVMNSKLPEAKRFKKWITNEVIPSIRKHGAYLTANTLENVINNPDFMIGLLNELKSEQEKRQTLEQEKIENAPKVLFADAVATSKTSILIGELAKILKQNGVENIGQNRLFDWMRNNGYLIRRAGTDYNMPTQLSMELGLFEIKETSVAHADGHITVNKTPKVTGKGQSYFINKLL